MNSLISVNNKFMGLNPKELVKLITSSKYTKGLEIYIEYNSDFEKEYLDKLVFEIKRNNLILQVHANVCMDIDKQLEYMKLLEQYSTILEYPIVVTFHTIFDDDKDLSISKTIDYLSRITNNVNNDKLIICLENLNNIRGYIRLGKDEIKNTILNDEKLFFTYDIGHELFDCGNLINLDNFYIDDIRNIHIHTFNKGKDHIPIYKNDIHWNELMKVLTFLVHNNYKYNIVYEYALDYCFGETIEEKIKDYLNSIDYVSEKYN